MKRYIICIFCLLSFNTYLFAQINNSINPTGGGQYTTFERTGDEITIAQRDSIVAMLKNNEASLKTTGLLKIKPTILSGVLFQWPLRQATGFSEAGYYGISNFVDHNPSFPNMTVDYSCGTRTYDLSSGYNHKGTDIFLWPFPWKKMTQNAVEVIAAAPGIIIGKYNGNNDKNCSFCTSCNWNAVYIMHADGSVAWYGHLKTNSLTSKAIGATVSVGEFLGVVGSSGSSTGPHLHFEVYSNNTYTQLVDPWAGNCNTPNGGNSWWAAQQPYRVPTLNSVIIHGAPPVFGCNDVEMENSKTSFQSNDVVYLGSYYRDQMSGQQAMHKVIRPDGIVYLSWTQALTATYNASYWYYSITLPAAAMQGVWRYEITYNTQAISASFNVNSPLPLTLSGFDVIEKDNTVALTITTENEINVSHLNILKSEDSRSFNTLASIKAKNEIKNIYSVTDRNLVEGRSYYKVELVDKDGSKTYSDVKELNIKPTRSVIVTNPFSEYLKINLIKSLNNVTISIFDISGKRVYLKSHKLLSAGFINLNTENLLNGAYYLKISADEKQILSTPLIKQ